MGKKVEVDKNKWLIPILLSIILAGAFLIRVLWQIDRVFVDGEVFFRGVDSWYHMRLVDNLVVNFPYLMRYDYFAQYPDGHSVGYLPLLTYLTGTLGQVFNYEVIAAWLPPILGTITILVVYLLGKELFSSKVGLLGAFLVAILPGEFLHRSLLGFTDHHVLESLLLCTTLLFLTRAYKTGNWKKWGVFAGVSLGFYNLTWIGTPLFLLVTSIWFWVEILRQVVRGENTSSLCKVMLAFSLVSLLVSWSFVSKEALIASWGLALASILLGLLTKYLRSRRRLLLGSIIVIPIAAAVVVLSQGWWRFFLALIGGGVSYIQEAMPLDLQAVFATYGVAFFVMLGGLWFAFWEKDRNKGLFLTWAVFLGIVAIGQRRWGYYTVVPVSLLAAYFTFYLTKWVVPRTRGAVVGVIVFFLVLTCLTNTVRLIQVPNLIQGSWYRACAWLEQNTPDPFPSEPRKAVYYPYKGAPFGSYNPKDAYNAVEIRGKEPQAEYGILSWWDYGHWIIRVGKRVPLTSPTHSGDVPSWFFTSTTLEEAEEFLGNLNVKYIMIDPTLLKAKWYAVQLRAGVENVKVEDTILWRLWNNDLPGYTQVYNKEGIKIYER